MTQGQDKSRLDSEWGDPCKLTREAVEEIHDGWVRTKIDQERFGICAFGGEVGQENECFFQLKRHVTAGISRDYLLTRVLRSLRPMKF